MSINIFIQARMSSKRFPGKVLAPFRGTPIIKSLLDNAQEIKGVNKVVVLTSDQKSDDPLAAYLNSINQDHYRGSLNNVFSRFKEGLQNFPCDFFLRLCADSPVLDKGLIQFFVDKINSSDYQFLSNVHTRTFPKGQSIEAISSNKFLEVNADLLTEHEQEHVMPYFYKNSELVNSLFIESLENLSEVTTTIDTLEDLEQLEKKPNKFKFNQEQLCLRS